jgi:uncharacterized protein YprB with RNaseH-like and TPR domain
MAIIFDIETTGLNPYTDCIVTIQLKVNDTVHVWKKWESDELQIIMEFLEVLRTIPSSQTILGYNNLKFDLPFIVGRLTALRGMNAEIYQLLHGKKWLDLYQLLGDDYQSMDQWLAQFGIKRNCRFVGKDMPILYAQGRYKDIVEHATEDLVLCERLFEILADKMPLLRTGKFGL